MVFDGLKSLKFPQNSRGWWYDDTLYGVLKSLQGDTKILQKNLRISESNKVFLKDTCSK